jgi:hypothetical protein
MRAPWHMLHPLSQRLESAPRSFDNLKLVLQQVIEQRAEIGLDDVKLALSYGHSLRTIVDNPRAMTRGHARCGLEITVHMRAIGGLAPTVVQDDPCC